MSIAVMSRSVWNTEPPYFQASDPAFPNWNNIIWLIAHWPGGNQKITTDAEMANVIRAEQRQYRAKNPPYDLGYNWLLDPWGKFWESRGFQYRNAANDGSSSMKARYGNINAITLSVQIKCGLGQGANDVQQKALQKFQYEVYSRSGRWIPWHPHSYVDATDCCGDVNRALISAGAFNYQQETTPTPPTPTPTPPPVNPPWPTTPTNTNPARRTHTMIRTPSNVVLEYDGFSIRRVKTAGGSQSGTIQDVTDQQMADILQEPNVIRVGVNPWRMIPGYENPILAQLWDSTPAAV